MNTSSCISCHRKLAKRESQGPLEPMRARETNHVTALTNGTGTRGQPKISEKSSRRNSPLRRTLFCASQTSILFPSEISPWLKIYIKTSVLSLPPVTLTALRASSETEYSHVIPLWRADWLTGTVAPTVRQATVTKSTA